MGAVAKEREVAEGEGYGRPEARNDGDLGGTWGQLVLLRGGRVLGEGQAGLSPGDHTQVRFRGVGGGGDNGIEQAGAQGGAPSNEGGTSQTLERIMEMMRLQGEQLQIVAASTRGLQKEVEGLKSGNGKEQQCEEKGEAFPPLLVANVERTESAPEGVLSPLDRMNHC